MMMMTIIDNRQCSTKADDKMSAIEVANGTQTVLQSATLAAAAAAVARSADVCCLQKAASLRQVYSQKQQLPAVLVDKRQRQLSTL